MKPVRSADHVEKFVNSAGMVVQGTLYLGINATVHDLIIKDVHPTLYLTSGMKGFPK